MRYIVGILMALVALVGVTMAAEQSAVDAYTAPTLPGSDLKAEGRLGNGFDGPLAGADGYPYQFFDNGTMFINEKIFGNDVPINALVKQIFDYFPEVKTVVLQADGGMTFDRNFTTLPVGTLLSSNGNYLTKPIHSFDKSPAPGDREATWEPSI